MPAAQSSNWRNPWYKREIRLLGAFSPPNSGRWGGIQARGWANGRGLPPLPRPRPSGSAARNPYRKEDDELSVIESRDAIGALRPLVSGLGCRCRELQAWNETESWVGSAYWSVIEVIGSREEHVDKFALFDFDLWS
jgi:hypothetical protein